MQEDPAVIVEIPDIELQTVQRIGNGQYLSAEFVFMKNRSRIQHGTVIAADLAQHLGIRLHGKDFRRTARGAHARGIDAVKRFFAADDFFIGVTVAVQRAPFRGLDSRHGAESPFQKNFSGRSIENQFSRKKPPDLLIRISAQSLVRYRADSRAGNLFRQPVRDAELVENAAPADGAVHQRRHGATG